MDEVRYDVVSKKIRGRGRGKREETRERELVIKQEVKVRYGRRLPGAT